MANNKSGMSPMEIDEVRTINPETAAHNIVLAYIQSALKEKNLPLGEIMSIDSIKPIAIAYTDVYNYAFNFVTYENKAIDEVE